MGPAAPREAHAALPGLGPASECIVVGEGDERELARALRDARCEIVAVAWGTGRIPLDRISDWVSPIATGEADLVVARRSGWPGLAGGLARLVAGAVSPVADPFSGFVAVRRDAMDSEAEPLAAEALALVWAQGCESSRLQELEIPVPAPCPRPSAAAWRALAHAAGARAPAGVFRRAMLAALAGAALDAGVFAALRAGGVALRHAEIASFGASLAVFLPLAATWVFGRPPAAGRLAVLGRFAVVALLALGVRGGVLAWGMGAGSAGLSAALLGSYALASGVMLVGCAFWVFPGSRPRSGAWGWSVASIGIISYLLVLRSVYLGVLELMPDEAYHWTWAAHPDLGYLDHPPLTAWAIASTMALFGKTELGVRASAWLAGGLTVGFLYVYGRELFGRHTGFHTALLGACLPFYFGVGFVIMPDSWQFACWTASLTFAALALLREKRWAWWALGASLGIGFLSKYNISLLGVGVAVFVVLDPRSRHWLRRPEPYGAALLSLVCLSPVLVWNYQHDWASFLFQTSRRFERHVEFSSHWLPVHASLLLTPTVFLATLWALCPGRLGALGRSADPDARRRRLFAAVLTGVPLAPFLIDSFALYPRAHWTASAWLAALPSASVVLMSASPDGRGGLRGLRRTWAPTAVVLLLFYGLGLHYIALGLPGVPYGKPFDRYFWSYAVPEVEAVRAELARETGADPVVASTTKWSIAASLNFYGPPAWRDRVGSRNLFGKQASMWDTWNPVDDEIGRPMVLVGREELDLKRRKVVTTLEGMGPIERVTLERDGVPLRTLYYRVADRYDGPPKP